MILPNLQELRDNFNCLDDIQERYAYIIELGQMIDDLPEKYRRDEYKIPGCISQLWLHIDKDDHDIIKIHADSDALIVKGLVAIIMIIYHNQPLSTVDTRDARDIFDHLDLTQHISINRRNGFYAMIDYIHNFIHKVTS